MGTEVLILLIIETRTFYVDQTHIHICEQRTITNNNNIQKKKERIKFKKSIYKHFPFLPVKKTRRVNVQAQMFNIVYQMVPLDMISFVNQDLTQVNHEATRIFVRFHFWRKRVPDR